MSKSGDIVTNDQKKGKTAVPAAEKVLDVLELMADSPNGLTMNEIVDSLGRTMGEIYRVVVYLADRGYLQQNPETNRYALTLRLFELSHRHDPTERLIHSALPMLERIAARTQQSCHLSVLNRENILVLASVQSPLPSGYAVRTGAVFPVERTSSGHVILAFSNQNLQERYIARRPGNKHSALRERFERICTRGFEDTPSLMVSGVQNLCVPVFDSRGVCGAITSGYIDQTGAEASPEDTLTTVRLAAMEMSKSLGFDLERSPHGSVLIA